MKTEIIVMPADWGEGEYVVHSGMNIDIIAREKIADWMGRVWINNHEFFIQNILVVAVRDFPGSTGMIRAYLYRLQHIGIPGSRVRFKSPPKYMFLTPQPVEQEL